MPLDNQFQPPCHSPRENGILIVGAGLAGMSAAALLGPQATVLEASAAPGGLVKSWCFDGYWFDHVIHLLYLPDDKTKNRIRAMLGEDLAPCPPVAWVESLAGCVRYPFQNHLGALPNRAALIDCIKGFAEVAFDPDTRTPPHYEAMLRRSFGGPMCEQFFYPYNRKMWRRPLDQLAPSGFQWNIDRPDFDALLKTILDPEHSRPSYNADGWYPRPGLHAPVRGMGYLAVKLAEQVQDLRLGHRVTSIDLERQELAVETRQGSQLFSWRDACLSTMPLPLMIKLCRQAPPDLVQDMDELRWNRVRSVGLCIQGQRPISTGNWRYYADESLLFTRLVFLHEFDPDMAPVEGWPLLAEITEPAEAPLLPDAELVRRVRQDVERTGILPAGSVIIAAHTWVCDPAYVVFTPHNQGIMTRARTLLESGGVTPLGRFGHWEYSSMGQVIRDGHAWAERHLARQPPGDPSTH